MNCLFTGSLYHWIKEKARKRGRTVTAAVFILKCFDYDKGSMGQKNPEFHWLKSEGI